MILGVLLSVLLAGFGTVLGDIVLSDEFYRTVNTFLNLLILTVVPYVTYRFGRKVSSKVENDLEPKVDKVVENVDKVVENTQHLSDWDGSERRDGE